MALEGTVLCSTGLQISQRGVETAAPGESLRVVDVAAVVPPEAPPTMVRRQDRSVWRRHWVEPHRLVIDFVDLALVEVDERAGTVTFDRHLSGDAEQHLLLDHVLPLVLARRGELVLHGGVISVGGRGAVLIGASGAGKSTLTAFAWQHGWTVGGDDGAVIFMGSPPTVEPTYATVRLSEDAAHLLAIDRTTTSTIAGKVRLAGTGCRAFRQAPVELCLLVRVQPVGSGAPARITPLDAVAAHAELFGSTFHAALSDDVVLTRTVERLASVVETASVAHLEVPRGVEGLAAAEQLLRSFLAGPAEEQPMGEKENR